MLSTRSGKEAYVEPVIEGDEYRFTVKVGKPRDVETAATGTKLGRGANFRCVMSGSPISSEHIYAEGRARRMGERMMAIVAEGDNGRVYLPPTDKMETVARQARPEWRPDIPMPENPRWFSPPLYGLRSFGDVFTPRQLVALTTFSDLVHEARERVSRDALAADMRDDGEPLASGGRGASAYADSVAVQLSFAVDKGANYWSTICAWHTSREIIVSTFGRQAIPMVWDYAEANPFSNSSGNVLLGIEQAGKMTATLGRGVAGAAVQTDATTQGLSLDKVVSTDPPYYDNIGYAYLSDFFYVWLRRSTPRLLRTLRHGGGSQGRRTGSHTLPARRQGESRDVLS